MVLSDRYLDLVGERIDVAIRHGALDDSSLAQRKLCDVRYFVVASPTYLADAKQIRSPQDIQHHPIVTFSLDGYKTNWRFRKGGTETSVSLNPAVTVSNAAVIGQCLREGIGLGLLADWTIENDLGDGSLVKVLPKWEAAGASFESSVWLVYPSRAYIPQKVRVFTDMLISSL